jgi:hypothetical protein
LVKTNCSPVASTASGSMVWFARNAAGLDDAYIGDVNCNGSPLLPPYPGNRAPADLTADGRYVLLTTAVGWDKATQGAEPGKGSQNAIQLYDRQTGTLSTLLPGALPTQRGVIWPHFNADGTKLVWAQIVRTPLESPPWGDWQLHVADVNLATGTLSNNRAWRDPAGGTAIFETYGWIPGTDQIVFASTTRATSTGFAAWQLFTLPDSLDPSVAPTRISPPLAPYWSWQQPHDVFHEFVHFAPGDPNTLYTSIASNTLGGNDLWSYDLRQQGSDGMLGQPQRISYFGGDLNANWGTQPVPGFPAPRYAVVTGMAWANGSWIAGVCPDPMCKTTDAYRITLGSTQTTAQAAVVRTPRTVSAAVIPHASSISRPRARRNGPSSARHRRIPGRHTSPQPRQTRSHVATKTSEHRTH